MAINMCDFLLWYKVNLNILLQIFLGFPSSKTFEQTTMNEITQSYRYKLDMLSKNQNEVTTDGEFVKNNNNVKRQQEYEIRTLFQVKDGN